MIFAKISLQNGDDSQFTDSCNISGENMSDICEEIYSGGNNLEGLITCKEWLRVEEARLLS